MYSVEELLLLAEALKQAAHDTPDDAAVLDAGLEDRGAFTILQRHCGTRPLIVTSWAQTIAPLCLLHCCGPDELETLRIAGRAVVPGGMIATTTWPDEEWAGKDRFEPWSSRGQLKVFRRAE